MKESFGLRKKMPDTFSVSPSAIPLEVPPDLSALPPVPPADPSAAPGKNSPEGVPETDAIPRKSLPSLSPTEEELLNHVEEHTPAP